jgi:molybdenum cofactor cytidylyltransferase
MSGIAAILLAAGGSRRFGSPKQLHRIGGRSLVRRAVETARSAGFGPIVAVVGSSAAQVADELAGAGADLVVNAGWEEGMGSSVRTGIRRVRQIAPEAAAAAILLADQPRVSETLLRSLAQRLLRGPEPAAACRYDGVLGPPAIFARPLFGRLEEIEGDEGARSILRSGEIEVAAIDFPAGAADIDSPSVS